MKLTQEYIQNNNLHFIVKSYITNPLIANEYSVEYSLNYIKLNKNNRYELFNIVLKDKQCDIFKRNIHLYKIDHENKYGKAYILKSIPNTKQQIKNQLKK